MAQMFFGPNFDAEEEWKRLNGLVANEDPMWGPSHQGEMGKEHSVLLIPHSRTTVLKFTLGIRFFQFLMAFFFL